MTEITDEMVRACALELFDDETPYWLGRARGGLAAALSARPASAGVSEIERLTAERDALTQDARWAINVLLETIAKKFDDWSTWDIWKSEAAGTVRSFKHDLSPARAGSKPEGDGWQPMATEPRDNRFRLYGLNVTNNRTGFTWFEVHYVAQDDDGQMVEPSGDAFSDWSYDDFEVWADAPQPPQSDATTAAMGTTSNQENENG